MRGYSSFQDTSGWRIRHDESGVIFCGFSSQAAAERGIPQIEEDFGINGDIGCGCGCGEIVTPGSRFRPGHDARHKGNLIKRFRSGDQAAFLILKAFGWQKFLREEELEQLGESRW